MIDWESERSVIVPPDRSRLGRRRFDRIAITSIYGNPLEVGTWSGAPARLAMALRRLGVEVFGIHSGGSRAEQILLAAQQAAFGFGIPSRTEAILRGRLARRNAAARVASAVARLGVRHVLHTGTLDLPPMSPPAGDRTSGVMHYVYCDDAWAVSLPHRPDLDRYSPRAIARFDELERRALDAAAHVFTFSDHLRRQLIGHYGIAPGRVTAAGCGTGPIPPYHGSKDYAAGRLLFVAKHLFREKGGELVLEAFRIALRDRPDLRLAIVGNPKIRRDVPRDPAIALHGHLPLDELQRLYRDASVLVQPMLNDPWGQVYVEALLSRTPVIGLARNALPEIIEHGRHGFAIDRADPDALAAAILDAVGDPARLARMGESGQRHALASYTWDIVARRIAFRHDLPPGGEAMAAAFREPCNTALPQQGAAQRRSTTPAP